MKQKVIGLSGHIDHGKTALVKALTGINTDSLSEEQKRGMTIDLGFAFLNDSITLIDVPGHEKFVKNMLSGVSSIDVAMLVIAADDGVMPQTREHFEILNLLKIPSGIIVLNKIDLADDDLLDIVELEIAELVQGTFMDDAPILRVSSIENKGIEKLRSTLINMCEQIPDKKGRGIFRMHVDRVFSMKGHGTVVTGTVNSGSIKAGDSVEILPGKILSRVRALQSHNQDVPSVRLGDRAAINLHGIDRSSIKRGYQISESGYLQTIKQMGIALHILDTAKKPLFQNQRVRIHLGTQEIMGRVALTNVNVLNPGENGPALFRLEHPLVATIGDRFIIRTYSPAVTIGGGEVLEIEIKENWKITKNKIQELYDNPTSHQILKLIEQEGATPLNQEQLKYRLGMSINQIENIVKQNDELFWKEYKHSKWLVTENQWHQLKEKIKTSLMKFHKENPMESGIQKEEIRQILQAKEQVIDALLLELNSTKQIDKEGSLWSHANFKLELNIIDNSIQRNVLSIIDKEGFTSSSLSELSEKTGYEKDRIIQILKVSEKQGKLLRIDEKFMFTNKNFKILKDKVNNHFKLNNEMSVPEFKEIAQTSRKYAVPLLEYFDKVKITYRDGNVRKLVK